MRIPIPSITALMQERTRHGRVVSGEIDAELRAAERRQVDLAAQGDAMAFRAIVERHHRGMHALATRMLGDTTEADDVVQDAFARAYCRIAQYDPRYRLSTWLYRIVLNLCRDRLKSARRRERPTEIEVPDDVSAGPEARLLDARRSLRVRRALAVLRPAYREILVLKDLQDLSYDEIHAITGAPITALKIRAIRAREKLRHALLRDATEEEA